MIPDWSLETADALELAFNPRLRIANFTDHVRGWSDASERARAELRYHADVPYGSAPVETLDLFPALSASPANPLLVFFHGGYWRSLDKRDFSWVATPYVSRGVSVAIVNYGLAPQTPLREIVAQSRRAVAFLVAESHRFSLDAGRVAVVGHSAGGHIVGMLVATDWPSVDRRLGRSILKGALSISGLFDLEPLTRTPFLRDTLATAVSTNDRLSPVKLRPLDSVRLLVAVGELESRGFHLQSSALATAWGDRAVLGPLVVPGRHHLDVCTSLIEREGPLYSAVAALLDPQS